MPTLQNIVSNKWTNPVIQALMALIIMAIANGVVKLLIQGGMSFETRVSWTLNLAFLFLYAIYNVILGLMFSPTSGYWYRSILCFIGLAMLSGVFAHWISGLSIDEAGSYRWLYFVFFIVYLLIMVIILAIKKIVHLAEQDDRRYDQIRNKN
jgi:hypothetical protein